MERKTALSLVERKAFGGTYHDSFSHASMFRKYQPHNFGMVTSQLFSSKLGQHLVNKKFTYMTIAKGNYYMLPGGVDDYQWTNEGDAEIDFRITELLVAPDSQPGKGGLSFKIAIDREWLHEPALLKSENSNLPFLRIIGQAKQRSANSFEYEVKLQTGDVNAWIPVEYLQPDRTLIDAGTMVSDELNTKYAGDQYGEMYKLQSWVGNVARKCEFSDKFIRTEIACAKEGRSMPKNAGYKMDGKSYKDGVGVGYLYQKDFKTKGNKVISKGVFITAVEARLLERTERDREFMMEWGQLQKTTDTDSSRTIKVAPGWRQIVRDGHYKQHNGTLSLSDIYEYLNEIFITRKGFSERHIKIASGEGGIEFLSRLLAIEANGFTTVDTTFIRNRKDSLGYHENELEFGAQFTKWKAPNGIIVELVHDPIKDDRHLFPEKAPGTNRTLESFAMDIFDFGYTDQKAEGARRPENITMVMQDGVEEYYTVSNVYDFQTGAIKDGGNAYSNNKECGIYRGMSGSLCVWDVSRVGRIEFVPALTV